MFAFACCRCLELRRAGPAATLRPARGCTAPLPGHCTARLNPKPYSGSTNDYKLTPGAGLKATTSLAQCKTAQTSVVSPSPMRGMAPRALTARRRGGTRFVASPWVTLVDELHLAFILSFLYYWGEIMRERASRREGRGRGRGKGVGTRSKEKQVVAVYAQLLVVSAHPAKE